jgi:hypothetical protein
MYGTKTNNYWDHLDPNRTAALFEMTRIIVLTIDQRIAMRLPWIVSMMLRLAVTIFQEITSLVSAIASTKTDNAW